MSTGSSRHSSPISRSAIAILRALGVGPPYRVIIALSFPPEPALQHIACVLPDRQRGGAADAAGRRRQLGEDARSEEHTSELQSLMRISYAVFCLKKKKSSNSDTNIISSTQH